MRLAVVALAIMAALTPLQAAAAGKATPETRGSYWTRILTAPSSGDENSFQRVFRGDAQQLSDRVFTAVAKVLGGATPQLNFVASIAPENGQSEVHLSATPAANQINVDPYATEGLIDEKAATHTGAVNQLPHEMAHLRQIAQVLASNSDREGGAQAFADIVAPHAAQLAHTYYNPSLNFDGVYAPLVQAVMNQNGRDWVLGGQFGHPPVAWP